MVLVVCSMFTFACKNKGGEDAAISKITVKGLERYYYVDTTIDLTGISVEIEYDNKTKTTYNKYEVDVEEKTKDDTQFIIYTDGLTDSNGKAQLGTHSIKYTIVGTDYVKSSAFVVTVNTDQSLAYDLDRFGLPETILAFKNIAFSGTDEAKFYEVTDKAYYVGDDNEFIFKPAYELSDDDGEVDAKLNTELKVELKNGNAYTVVGSEYYTYNPATYGVDFTETAIGKTFRLTISAKDFEEDMNGNDAVATFEVTVADGWNVTDAKDLGRMSIYGASDGIDLAKMHVFDDHVETNTAWQEFLGVSASEAKSVNGIFLHNKITVTVNDVPSGYIISGQNNFANGGLWDYSTLYMKYITNKDFTFNGNYFTLDFSSFPIILSQGLTPYTSENDTSLAESHARAFHFVGQMRETAGASISYDGQVRSTGKVTFKNVNMVGNINYNIDKTMVYSNVGEVLLDGEFACCSIIGVSCEGLNANYSNMIAKNMYIPYYVDCNSHVDIDKIKAYDCFNCAIYNYGGPEVNVTSSTFMRFGGPAIFLNSLTTDDGDLEVEANATLDENCKIENFINANAAWLSLYHSGAVVSGLIGNPGFAYYGFDIVWYRAQVDGVYKFMRYDELKTAGLVTDRDDLLAKYGSETYINFQALQFSKLRKVQPVIYSTFDFNATYANENANINTGYIELEALVTKLGTGIYMFNLDNSYNFDTCLTAEEKEVLFTYVSADKVLGDDGKLSVAKVGPIMQAINTLNNNEASQQDQAAALGYLIANTPKAVHYFVVPEVYETFVEGVFDPENNDPNVFTTSNGFVPGPAGTTIVPDQYSQDKNNFVYILADAGIMGQYGIVVDYVQYNN